MLPLKPASQSQPAGTLAPSELAGQSTEVHDLVTAAGGEKTLRPILEILPRGPWNGTLTPVLED